MERVFRQVKTELRFGFGKNVNFPPHTHDDVELVCVIQGEGIAHCDGRAFPLKQGDFFVAFPDQIHSYREFVDGQYVLLIIKPSRLTYLQELFYDQKPVEAACSGHEDLSGLLLAALEENHDAGNDLVVNGYLTAFFGKLFRAMPLERRGVSADTVSQVLQYCAAHFDQEICIRDICDHLHISRSHVSHLFSDQLHISFPEYIHALRLNKAKALMKDTGLNITQIAQASGFPTVRTFNRVFRDRYGCAPSEYRKGKQKS